MIFFKGIKLIKAIARQDAAEVSRLLEAGADPNAYSKTGQDFPLGHAVMQDAGDIIRLLIEHGASVKKFDMSYTFIGLAIKKDKNKALAALKEKINLSTILDNKESLIDHCIAQENFKCIKRMLDLGDPLLDCYKPILIKHAICNNDAEFISLLQKKGVGSDDLLSAACKYQSKDHERMFLYLEQGAIFDETSLRFKKELMHMAVKIGSNDRIAMLLDKGVNINISKEDDSGETPLHTAVRNNKFLTTEMLLKRGADPSLRNEAGLRAQKLAQSSTILNLFPKDVMTVEPEQKKNDEDWKLLAPDRIAHITLDAIISRKTTDIFNFTARERVTTIENLISNNEHSIIKLFDEIRDKTLLEQAHDELRNQGGTVLRESIYTVPRHKQLLDGLRR